MVTGALPVFHVCLFVLLLCVCVCVVPPHCLITPGLSTGLSLSLPLPTVKFPLRTARTIQTLRHLPTTSALLWKIYIDLGNHKHIFVWDILLLFLVLSLECHKDFLLQQQRGEVNEEVKTIKQGLKSYWTLNKAACAVFMAVLSVMHFKLSFISVAALGSTPLLYQRVITCFSGLHW